MTSSVEIKILIITRLLFLLTFLFIGGMDGHCQFGEEQIISTNADGALIVNTLDLDGDGDLDVLSASNLDDKIAWYQNDGSGNFGEQIIISNNASAVRSLYASDLDEDGDLDVLSAGYGDNEIAWYDNDGNGNFGERIIIAEVENPYLVNASDVDGDGDVDIIFAYTNHIGWYPNDGNGNFGEQIIIMTHPFSTILVSFSDLDGDGSIDVIYSTSGDISWYRNDGYGNFESQQLIFSPNNIPNSLYVSDIDGDGYMDLLSILFYGDIVWFRNDGNENFELQNPIFIIDNPVILSIYASDIDGDEDIDILSSQWFADKIAWYENDGTGNFGAQQIITTNADGVRSVFTSDLDGDGDIDVLSASENDNKIAWYENIINEGCTDEAACNYHPFFIVDNGSCCYDNCGCTNDEAENYDSSVSCDDGNCILLGCIDNTACNFDFYANTDDGSCVLAGCNDTNADNYDSSAGCNDFSCDYKIEGLVFFDENENGIFDGIDFGLPFQEITSSDNSIYLTNDEGIFYADATSESITFTLFTNESFPFNTTDNPQNVVNGINTSTNDFSLDFGISSEIPDFAICLDFYPPGNGYLCDDWVNHNLCYRNMGNVPINGILEVEYDPLFQDYQEVTEIDSVVGNIIYMSFENLFPGQNFCSSLEFLTPTADYIGEFLTSTGRVYGYYEGEQVAYGEDILIHEMTCSYDPNDKQVFPAGYEEPHYVLPETELEYLVRFQNTGNAAATNVLVTDTIDPSLDLSSFIIVANSHSVNTTIKTEERVIEFLFQNIMLPDSTTSEPESHGLISYKLTLQNDLDFETEINNTAYIYFDNNPPIITNTTWTTIYDCNDGLAVFESSSLEICLGEEISFENTQNYVENYNWFINEELMSTEQLFTNTLSTADQFEVLLETSNPLCVAENTASILVNPSPEITVSDDITLCEGESTILTVSGGESYYWDDQGTESELDVTPIETTTYEVTATNGFDCSTTDEVTVYLNPIPAAEITANQITLTAVEAETYQWYLNGNIIDGATFQTYEAQENGNYSVAVTNEFDCTSLSNEIIISVVGIEELSNQNIQLFPNPMQESSMLYFGESGINYQVKLFDSEGRLVHNYGNITDGQLEIQRKRLSSGNYLVEVLDLESKSKFGIKLRID